MSLFTPEQEAYIEHEVQIRNNTGSIKNLTDTMIRIEDKIDSHFKWTLGTIILLIITVVSFMATLIITTVSS